MRNHITQNRARSLRNHTTDTEQYLWRYLRGHQLGGHRFRRQVPTGNYIADFACLEAKLIIELDGGQHQEQAGYDARRDLQMEAQGFRVLRFWDNQVFQETQAVLGVILRALEDRTFLQPACPHPSPPPQAGEGAVSDPQAEEGAVSDPQAEEGANTQAGAGANTQAGAGANTQAGAGANTQAEEEANTPSLARSASLLPPLHAQRAGEGWGGGIS